MYLSVLFPRLPHSRPITDRIDDLESTHKTRISSSQNNSGRIRGKLITYWYIKSTAVVIYLFKTSPVRASGAIEKKLPGFIYKSFLHHGCDNPKSRVNLVQRETEMGARSKVAVERERASNWSLCIGCRNGWNGSEEGNHFPGGKYCESRRGVEI